MLHPSYSDLMKVVNSEVEPGEAPVVNSRYSIVMATSKRARQLISGDWDPMIDGASDKPLSTAVEELYQGKIKIMTEEEARRTREAIAGTIISLDDEGASMEMEEIAEGAAEEESEDAEAESVSAVEDSATETTE
jgi:DNA-directed RNA polymerase subunit omega